jgi:hypothetical protein
MKKEYGLGLLIGVIIGGPMGWWSYSHFSQKVGAQSSSTMVRNTVPMSEQSKGASGMDDKEMSGPPLLKRSWREIIDTKKIDDFTLELQKQDFSEYLTKNGRSAESLLAVFSIKRDLALLKEAYERFPDDLRTVLMVQQKFDALKLTGVTEKELIDKLIKLDPKNSLGQILKLRLPDQSPEEIKEQLKNIHTTGKLNSYAETQRLANFEAYLSVGIDPTLAKMATRVADPIMFSNLSHTIKSVADQAKEQLKSGQEAAALETTGLIIGLSDKLNSTPSTSTLINDLAQDAIKGIGLNIVPPETEIGETGQTAGEMIKELEQKSKDFYQPLEVDDMLNRMKQLDPSQFELYLERTEVLGEQAGLKWLLENTQK